MSDLDDFDSIDSDAPTRQVSGGATGNQLLAPHLKSLRLVGRGGMGTVSLGLDSRIGREVAVKELQPFALADDRLRSRFLREARITGRLEHPNIVPVYETSTSPDGRPFYVMKFVRGRTLADALNECRDDNPDRALAKRMALLDALIDTCNGIAYAHSKGVVHRDLKPSNIILGSFGETVTLDWGLARMEFMADEVGLDDPAPGEMDKDTGSGHLTVAGEVLGTPAFMAPEQIDPRLGTVDRRSDVFSLGCILHQILVGRPPFQGSAETILKGRMIPESVPPVRTLAPQLPGALAAICDRALALDPAKRFPDAGAMAQELRAFRDGRLVSTHTYTPLELAKRFLARYRVLVFAFVVAVLGLLAGTGISIRAVVVADAAKDEAERQKARAEAALTVITEKLQAKLSRARDLADRIESNADDLALDLADAVESLEGVALDDLDAMEPDLWRLSIRHPAIVKLVVARAPGIITAMYPFYEDQIGADVSEREHVRWAMANQQRNFSKVFTSFEGVPVVSWQQPWETNGDFVGVLAALVDPDAFIREAIRPDPSEYVWVTQNGGYVLYSTNEDHIGRDLTAEGVFRANPELARFSDSIRNADDGIGHVELTTADGVTVHWIAGWATYAGSELSSWKVVVAEPYVEGTPTTVRGLDLLPR